MPDKRPAYVIAEVEVTDPAGFQDYVAKAMPTLAGYNARLDGAKQAHRKEGTAPVGDIVIRRVRQPGGRREMVQQRGIRRDDSRCGSARRILDSSSLRASRSSPLVR